MFQKSSVMRYAVLCLGVFAVFKVESQAIYPETLWVPVTYYDFHWNTRADWDQPVTISRGNPDFEPIPIPNNNAILSDIVGSTLDADGKPVRGTRVYFSLGIAYWFRLWEDSAQGDRWTYNYTVAGTGAQTVASHDTAFKNIAIIDALPMVLLDPVTGVYQFDSEFMKPYDTLGGFFPINNRGYGTEGNVWGNNYAWTMEIRSQFRYRPGLTFDFRGDDDVWVFINNRRILDLGGIHGPQVGQFTLDATNASQYGLVPNQLSTISMFYVERHVSNSNLRMLTNLFMPNTIFLEVVGDTMVSAGIPEQVLRARILDENGHDMIGIDWDDIRWSIVGSTAQQGDLLYNATGQTVTFSGTVAYRIVTIQAIYTDPTTNVQFMASKSIWVGPGPADHVVIEPLINDSVVQSLNADMPIARIMVPLYSDSAKAYAVLRDAYQNYVSLAQSVTWSSSDISLMTATAMAGKGWIGVIRRGPNGSPPADSAFITANVTGLQSASARVVLEYALKCAAPVATPPSCQFVDQLSIVLTCMTPGVQIYYCIDCDILALGTGGAILYTGSILLSGKGDKTVRAIAIKDSALAYLPSDIMTEVYSGVDSLSASSPSIGKYLTPGLHILSSNGNIILLPVGKNLDMSTITISDLSGRQIARFLNCRANLPVTWNFSGQSGHKSARALYLVQLKSDKEMIYQRIFAAE